METNLTRVEMINVKMMMMAVVMVVSNKPKNMHRFILTLNLQYRLCPFNLDTTPWLRHLAHFGWRDLESMPVGDNGFGVSVSVCAG